MAATPIDTTRMAVTGYFTYFYRHVQNKSFACMRKTSNISRYTSGLVFMPDISQLAPVSQFRTSNQFMHYTHLQTFQHVINLARLKEEHKLMSQYYFLLLHADGE